MKQQGNTQRSMQGSMQKIQGLEQKCIMKDCNKVDSGYARKICNKSSEDLRKNVRKNVVVNQHAGMRKGYRGLRKKVCSNNSRKQAKMYEKKKNAKQLARNYPRQCAEKAFKKNSTNYATNVARKQAISMQIVYQPTGQIII